MERIQREEDSRGVDSDCRDECPRGRVDAHHKFAATIGDGVSVAKAQRLWTVVVGP
uniref:Uncharacterized protein K0081B11.22 n=1 Tax=Oryza sativa subsp. indica TaxID=39946 RepID=C8TF50_ORYSI|nr:hypothetical protein [Oryza sativa Indica Group]BAI39818.1 hypothetical protein [Oryza sativa Indica Group]